jgi:excisionase family DNA binding protein
MQQLSATQTAKLLGISRMQVWRKIKQGKITAHKVGKTYVVDKKTLGPIFEHSTKQELQLIDQAVAGTISEYGEVLKRLGKE